MGARLLILCWTAEVFCACREVEKKFDFAWTRDNGCRDTNRTSKDLDDGFTTGDREVRRDRRSIVE
jgi:hypothetical protein